MFSLSHKFESIFWCRFTVLCSFQHFQPRNSCRVMLGQLAPTFPLIVQERWRSITMLSTWKSNIAALWQAALWSSALCEAETVTAPTQTHGYILAPAETHIPTGTHSLTNTHVSALKHRYTRLNRLTKTYTTHVLAGEKRPATHSGNRMMMQTH